MYDCVQEKTTAVTAALVHRVTVRIWADREAEAQRTGERASRDAGESVETQRQAGWGARLRAVGTRGPVIWSIHQTPGLGRRWLLAPPTLETQTDDPRESEAARTRGDLVVEPDDTVQDIIDKMEAARTLRAAS